MTANMGTVDRALRGLVVAPAAVAAGLLVGAGTVVGVVLFVVAGLMLVTAVTAYCPTYALVGITTRPSGVHHAPHGLRGGHA